MRTRTFLLAILLFSLAYAADPNPQPTKSRWMIKTSLPTHPSAAKLVKIEKLMGLESFTGHKQSEYGPGGAANDVRITEEALPAGSGLKEGDIIKTKAYLHLFAYETSDDDDYHIQITPELADATHKPKSCLVVELPQPDAQHVVDASLRDIFTSEREWMKTNLTKGKDPSTNGSVMQHAVYVEVTGQLFYDGWHAAHPEARGKKGCAAATAWELHPITAIKFAPKPH